MLTHNHAMRSALLLHKCNASYLSRRRLCFLCLAFLDFFLCLRFVLSSSELLYLRTPVAAEYTIWGLSRSKHKAQ